MGVKEGTVLSPDVIIVVFDMINAVDDPQKCVTFIQNWFANRQQ